MSEDSRRGSGPATPVVAESCCLTPQCSHELDARTAAQAQFIVQQDTAARRAVEIMREQYTPCHSRRPNDGNLLFSEEEKIEVGQWLGKHLAAAGVCSAHSNLPPSFRANLDRASGSDSAEAHRQCQLATIATTLQNSHGPLAFSPSSGPAVSQHVFPGLAEKQQQLSFAVLFTTKVDLKNLATTGSGRADPYYGCQIDARQQEDNCRAGVFATGRGVGREDEGDISAECARDDCFVCDAEQTTAGQTCAGANKWMPAPDNAIGTEEARLVVAPGIVSYTEYASVLGARGQRDKIKVRSLLCAAEGGVPSCTNLPSHSVPLENIVVVDFQVLGMDKVWVLLLCPWAGAMMSRVLDDGLLPPLGLHEVVHLLSGEQPLPHWCDRLFIRTALEQSALLLHGVGPQDWASVLAAKQVSTEGAAASLNAGATTVSRRSSSRQAFHGSAATRLASPTSSAASVAGLVLECSPHGLCGSDQVPCSLGPSSVCAAMP